MTLQVRVFVRALYVKRGQKSKVLTLDQTRPLRSDGTNRLLVPPVRLPTVGNRAFTVAGPRVWNTLPEDITTSRPLMSAFCQRLKPGSSESHIRTSSSKHAVTD